MLQNVGSSDVDAILDTAPFQESRSKETSFGDEKSWKTLGDNHYDDETNLAAVSAFFSRRPHMALAMLTEMTEKWAPPEETDSRLTMTDGGVVDQMLRFKGEPEKAMTFIGARFRVSVKQAAMAFHVFQQLDKEFK